ncbi:hypothetical protein CFN79_02025 [Chromobacterium vaccinii]|nr:hypothetical protein CFN79_02025 [Chromobacterium vaccinii]
MISHCKVILNAAFAIKNLATFLAVIPIFIHQFLNWMKLSHCRQQSSPLGMARFNGRRTMKQI